VSECVRRVAVLVREGDVLVLVVGLAGLRRRAYHFLPFVLPPPMDQSSLQEGSVMDLHSCLGGSWCTSLLVADGIAKHSCGPWLLDEPVDLVVQLFHVGVFRGLARLRRRDDHLLPLVLSPPLDQSGLQESCIVDRHSCFGGCRGKALRCADVTAKPRYSPWLLDEAVDLVVQRLPVGFFRCLSCRAFLAALFESSKLLFGHSFTNHVCERTRQSVDEGRGGDVEMIHVRRPFGQREHL
jgi:hypothetical protein